MLHVKIGVSTDGQTGAPAAVKNADLLGFLALYGGPHGWRGPLAVAWATTMVALTLLGGGWSALGILPLLWYERTRLFGKLLAAAIVGQASVVWFIKLAVGRTRPWIIMGLAAPLGSPHDGSFPSGHASGSFCVAAFLVTALPAAWPSSPWTARLVAGLGVFVAALIALSRVYLGAHFPSDVLAGAALGSLAGATAGSVYARRATTACPPARTAPAARASGARRASTCKWR
ncbi:MAG: phosphatase PAP2 family protein [Myxococcota bacterium]|nr:phosphatase PAP2 family protein [Myxococcota bacterium]